MTPSRQYPFDVDAVEPPLPELSLLRLTLERELPPPLLQQKVRARLRESLCAAQRERVRPAARALLVCALVLLAVPSAFAATPVVGDWVEHFFELLPWVAPRATAQHDPDTAALMASRRPAPLPTKRVAGNEFSGADAPGMRAIAGNSDLKRPPPATASPRQTGSQRPIVPSTRAEVEREQDPSRQPPPASRPFIEQAREAPRSMHTRHLQQERMLLEGARIRLSAGDATGALELAALHEQRFARGLLAHERSSIQRQARALLKQDSESYAPRNNTQ